jgi:hypothetical protein
MNMEIVGAGELKVDPMIYGASNKTVKINSLI